MKDEAGGEDADAGVGVGDAADERCRRAALAAATIAAVDDASFLMI
jgi:hypothetical protein